MDNRTHPILPRNFAKIDREVCVKVFTHAMFDMEKQDISFSKALNLIGQLPTLLEKADPSNRGLGHPLLYSCVPLEQLIRPELLGSTQHRIWPKMSATMMQNFNEMLEVKEKNHLDRIVILQRNNPISYPKKAPKFY
jgi:hypothetical protein